MSKIALRYRRVQPSRHDVRAEISAKELAEEDLTTTRPIPVIRDGMTAVQYDRLCR